MAEALRDATDSVVGLARTLRAAGVPASPERVQAAVTAIAALDPAHLDDVYWAGRLTLVGTHDHLARYDAVFRAYFGDRPGRLVRRPTATLPKLVLVPDDDAEDAPEEPDGAQQRARAASSRTEQLRHRDVRTLDAADRAELNRLLALLSLPAQPRRTRRMRPASRGAVDHSRTLRAWLAAGGEPARLRRHAHGTRPRRVVLLVDVSGSMDPYADALLRFAHAAVRRGGTPTEVFALGTRLTRISREMALRDPDRAMAAVAEAVPDAGGGTRLGEMVKEFLDRWGQRGAARGAVVVVMSDGWERGDATLLGEQMARLHRLAHRVVWSQPAQGGGGLHPGRRRDGGGAAARGRLRRGSQPGRPGPRLADVVLGRAPAGRDGAGRATLVTPGGGRGA